MEDMLAQSRVRSGYKKRRRIGQQSRARQFSRDSPPIFHKGKCQAAGTNNGIETRTLVVQTIIERNRKVMFVTPEGGMRLSMILFLLRE